VCTRRSDSSRPQTRAADKFAALFASAGGAGGERGEGGDREGAGDTNAGEEDRRSGGSGRGARQVKYAVLRKGEQLSTRVQVGLSAARSLAWLASATS
jgi:hypothetical protein